MTFPFLRHGKVVGCLIYMWQREMTAQRSMFSVFIDIADLQFALLKTVLNNSTKVTLEE